MLLMFGEHVYESSVNHSIGIRGEAMVRMSVANI